MLHIDWLMTLALASVILSNIACYPYIRDMLQGRARPMRSTWLIWSILSIMTFLSNMDKGATASLLFIAVEVVETVGIFLLSIRYGMGSFLRRGDLLVLGIAALGVGLWWMTQDSLYALIIAICISALGGVLTVIKAYRAPETETASCWALSGLAAFGGMVSVGAWSPVLLAYPLYLCVLYGLILGAILLGRRRQDSLSRPALRLRPIPVSAYPSKPAQPLAL